MKDTESTEGRNGKMTLQNNEKAKKSESCERKDKVNTSQFEENRKMVFGDRLRGLMDEYGKKRKKKFILKVFIKE